MPLSADQLAEIEAQRAQSNPTRRVVAEGMEDHLYTAHQLSKKEIEDLLKKGAYGAVMDEDDDANK